MSVSGEKERGLVRMVELVDVLRQVGVQQGDEGGEGVVVEQGEEGEMGVVEGQAAKWRLRK